MNEQQIRQIVKEELSTLFSKAFAEAKSVNAYVSQMQGKSTAGDLHSVISEILQEFGIPQHLKGYRFLREAIAMAHNDIEVLDKITKLLYPVIADHFKTTPSRVERGIRNAIEVAWDGDGIKARIDKPTNGHFIAMVADKLRTERLVS